MAERVFSGIKIVVNSRWFFALSLSLLVAIYGTKSDRYFGWTNVKVKTGEPILSDGAGYYAYLPQWFIYGTTNFEFLPKIRETYSSSRFSDNVYISGGTQFENKYYTGTAVSMVPFFAVAHIYAGMNGHEQDGYSLPYQFMANVASIFYFLFGCLGIYFLLRRFGIDRFWIIVVLTGIGLGTNLSYFTNVLTPFSHVFSFGVVAWMMLYAKKWADEHTWLNFVLFCLFLGWAAILRPTNVLVLTFVPFLFPSTRIFLQRIGMLFTKKWLHLFTGVIVFGTILFFQLWNTHEQTGQWSLNTYTNESFDYLLEPKITEVLFGWRKGLFIYAPILILMIPGLVVLFLKERRLFWGTLLFFAGFTYITASWWCWWYGGGLGMRPYIDVLSLLFLPIAFFVQYGGNFLRTGALAIVAVTVWMYQVYEFQMKNNILHYDDISYEQFRNVFMKKDARYFWSMHQVYEKLPAKKKKKQIRHPFLIHGKPMSSSGYFELLNTDYGDNPIVTILSDSLNRNAHFGAEITGNVLIHDGICNPSFSAEYFKGGQLIRKNDFVIGPFIDQTKKLCYVRLELYPGLRYSDFDSVRVQFYEGYEHTGVKGLKFSEQICF